MPKSTYLIQYLVDVPAVQSEMLSLKQAVRLSVAPSGAVAASPFATGKLVEIVIESAGVLAQTRLDAVALLARLKVI